MAKMNVDSLAVDDRRGAGVAVLTVNSRSGLAVLVNHFGGPESLARRGVQAECLQ